MKKIVTISAVALSLLLTGCSGTGSSSASSAPASPAPANSATAQPSASPKPAEDGVAATLTEEYCTPVSHVCFKYPKGYKVDVKQENGSHKGADGAIIGQLQNPEGKRVMGFFDGLTGFGEACDPSQPMAKVDILATTPLKLAVLKLTTTTDHAFIVKAIVEYKGKYYARQYVSADRGYAEPGKVEECGGFGMSDLLTISADPQPSASNFDIDSMFLDKNMPSYPSKEAAEKAFDTPLYKLNFEILKTLTKK